MLHSMNKQNFSPVIIHYCVEPVSDRQNGALPKLRLYSLLYELVGLNVHGSRRLVQYYYFRFPQQRPGQAHQLTLTDTEVVVGLCVCYKFF